MRCTQQMGPGGWESGDVPLPCEPSWLRAQSNKRLEWDEGTAEPPRRTGGAVDRFRESLDAHAPRGEAPRGAARGGGGGEACACANMCFPWLCCLQDSHVNAEPIWKAEGKERREGRGAERRKRGGPLFSASTEQIARLHNYPRLDPEKLLGSCRATPPAPGTERRALAWVCLLKRRWALASVLRRIRTMHLWQCTHFAAKLAYNV